MLTAVELLDYFLLANLFGTIAFIVRPSDLAQLTKVSRTRKNVQELI